MTVQELIEKLTFEDETLEIRILDHEFGFSPHIKIEIVTESYLEYSRHDNTSIKKERTFIGLSL